MTCQFMVFRTALKEFIHARGQNMANYLIKHELLVHKTRNFFSKTFFT